MASTIGKVRAVFTASTSGLTAGVNTAAASMRRMEGAVASLRGPLNSLVAINAAQLFGSIASAATNYARSLAGLIASTTETVSSQNDLANRLGLTYGELAGLSFAGSLVGVSMDTIGAAMTRAQVAFANAANGSKTATAAFQAIGLSVADLNNLSAEQQFEAIAQAISQLPTEAERAAAAVRIFGRAGAQLLPLFQEGAAGIQAAREEADRFGLTLTNAQSGNIDAMGDAFDRAQAAITGVIQQIVAYLAPAIENVTTQFTNLVGSMGGANIGQTIGDGILQGARFLAQIGDFVIQNFSGVFEYLSSVGGQWNAVFDFGNRVAQFFYGAFKTFEAVGNIVAAAIMTAFSYFSSTAGEFAAAYSQAASQNIGAAQAAFSAAFSAAAPDAGQAIAGPLVTSLDAAVAKAKAAGESVDAAKAQSLEVKQVVDLAPVNEAVKGIDSRSREGVSEMFRLMRGAGADVQEEQLSVLKQIQENTSGGDLEDPLVEFAIPGA